MWIEIDKTSCNSKKNIIVGVIYRIPGSDIDIFNYYINETLNKIKNENKSIFHMGDYNLNIMNNNTHALTDEFLNINISNSFLPLITKPTRITKTASSLIDNIFTNEIEEINIKKGIIVSDISDHLPQFYINNHINNQSLNKEIFYYKRNINMENIMKFHVKLEESKIQEIIKISNTKNAYTSFHKILTDTYNKCFPIKKHKIKSYTNNKPWLTQGIKNGIKHKNFLYSIYLKNPNIKNEKLYKTYKNKLLNIIRKEERNFLQTKIEKYKNNMKKSWETIKEIKIKKIKY